MIKKEYALKPCKFNTIQFTINNWEEVKKFTNNLAKELIIANTSDILAYCILLLYDGNKFFDVLFIQEYDYIIKTEKKKWGDYICCM